MFVIKTPISLEEIQKNHNHFFEKMVKMVVDIEKEVIALDAELHVDQENLWGANIYFNPPKLLELNSFINICTP